MAPKAEIKYERHLTTPPQKEAVLEVVGGLYTKKNGVRPNRAHLFTEQPMTNVSCLTHRG